MFLIKTAIILSLIAIAITSYIIWYDAVMLSEQAKDTLHMECIHACRLYDNYKIDITFNAGILDTYLCECADSDGGWVKIYDISK